MFPCKSRFRVFFLRARSFRRPRSFLRYLSIACAGKKRKKKESKAAVDFMDLMDQWTNGLNGLNGPYGVYGRRRGAQITLFLIERTCILVCEHRAHVFTCKSRFRVFFLRPWSFRRPRSFLRSLSIACAGKKKKKKKRRRKEEQASERGAGGRLEIGLYVHREFGRGQDRI